MKNLHFLLALVLLVLSLKACDTPDSDLNSDTLQSEMNNRQIRRISEGTIMETAFKKGKKMIDTLESVGEKKKKVSDSLAQTYRFGDLQPIVDDLQQKNKAEIKKILVSDLETSNVRELEKEVFEAYQYNIVNGLKVEDNVQLLDSQIFYSAPIVEKGELTGMWSIYFDKKELIKSIN